MKKAILIIITVLLAAIRILPGQAIADETIRSGIAWYMDLHGFTLSQAIEDGMHDLYKPQEADCGDVQVTLQEVLYDGYWIYTSASVVPTSPEMTLVMPGSAEMGDRVSGGNGEKSRMDSRTFREAASEDGKRLLSVYVYPKEFDYLPYYFLDHRQDASGSSTLLSGSHLLAPSGIVTIHWSVQIYEVDKNTGIYTLADEHEFPAVITPLGDAAVKKYKPPAEEALPIDSITLIHTALTTYAIPSWVNEEDQGVYAFTLLDENNHQIRQGAPPDVYTFSMEQPPDELFVQMLNTQSLEQSDVVRFPLDIE